MGGVSVPLRMGCVASRGGAGGVDREMEEQEEIYATLLRQAATCIWYYAVASF